MKYIKTIPWDQKKTKACKNNEVNVQKDNDAKKIVPNS